MLMGIREVTDGGVPLVARMETGMYGNKMTQLKVFVGYPILDRLWVGEQ